MSFDTADLCDRFAERENFQIAEPILRQFGGRHRFCGKITTLKVFEDDALIRTTLAQPVQERILVVDGGGSRRCALLDADVAGQAAANGWQGIVIYGCIRSAEHIEKLPIGVMALNTHPLHSRKHGQGEANLLLTFAGVNFKQNHYLYADCDGIIVADGKLD